SSKELLRDSATWHHLVWVMDVDAALQADRFRMYINGERVTAFRDATVDDVNLSGSDTTVANTAVTHYVGRASLSAAEYMDGYLSDVHFVDGQALGPTAFANETENGEWLPKSYTGTYGTNGFHLGFSDPTNTTTLGADASGNGNHW